ncbi:MAG: hypothetical protein KKA42_17020, partial [candidate division Zixibacteria bacterium]|nr:hypothetical protein [candidate division Zixibacteria bacterium]
PSADSGAGEVVRVDTSTGEIISSDAPISSVAPVPDPGSDGISLVGRFGDLYLLFQSGSDMLVVDQHTAHERVLYEDNLRRLDDQKGVAQQLLLPVQVELSPEQFALFEESREMLTHTGFEVAEFGGCTVRIEAVPSVLTRKSPETALRSMLDDIGSLRKTGYDLKKAVAQSLACRSAVMAGDRLTDHEAIGLVSRLLRCENAYSCPHGRPTFVRISKEDLDRQFGRG